MARIEKCNKSGCVDNTARLALQSIQDEQDRERKRMEQLIWTLKNTIELSGFELLARIEVRDQRTGKCYR
jgi:hypothetical protein